MITSRKEYRLYLEADRIALGLTDRRIVIGVPQLRFQKKLRKTEYFMNCRNSWIWKPYILLLKYRLFRSGMKLGYTIPPNVFGPGLAIVHIGTVVVSNLARIGENCRIHTCVNIGADARHGKDAPTIGDNVYIGPGAKIFGGIEIADGIAIGANSVVLDSFEERNISIAGIPARKIGAKGSDGIMIRATSVLDGKNRNR